VNINFAFTDAIYFKYSKLLVTFNKCLRPFGSGVILGGYDRDGPQLFMVEPSGISYVS